MVLRKVGVLLAGGLLIAACSSDDGRTPAADDPTPSASSSSSAADYYGISLHDAFAVIPCNPDLNYNEGTAAQPASHCTKYGGEQWVYVYPDEATQESAKPIKGCGGHLELPGLVICASSLDVGELLQAKLGGHLA